MFDELKVEMKEYYIFHINDKSEFLIDAEYSLYNLAEPIKTRTYMTTTYIDNHNQLKSCGSYVNLNVLWAIAEYYKSH
jgi:hypothetical protein